MSDMAQCNVEFLAVVAQNTELRQPLAAVEDQFVEPAVDAGDGDERTAGFILNMIRVA